MLGGDFETVRGPWGLRGEVAAFVDDNFQAGRSRIVEGSSIDAGVGVDRKAGDYRVSATVLAHRESYDEPIARGGRRCSERAHGRLADPVGRSQLRARALPGPDLRRLQRDRELGFLRGIATAKLRDNVALEGSAGWFAGDGGIPDRTVQRQRLRLRAAEVLLLSEPIADASSARAGNASDGRGRPATTRTCLRGRVPALVDAGVGNAAHLDADRSARSRRAAARARS